MMQRMQNGRWSGSSAKTQKKAKKSSPYLNAIKPTMLKVKKLMNDMKRWYVYLKHKQNPPKLQHKLNQPLYSYWVTNI